MTYLTGECARKFERQARYGRPKAAALEGVKRGSELARQIADQGRARITIEVNHD